MFFAILAFLAVFVLVGSVLVLLFYREAALDRISQVINPQSKQKTSLTETFQNTGSSIGNVVKRFENLMPKSENEVSVIKKRLMLAGFRNENAIKIFYGSKVLMPALPALIAMVSGLASLGPFFVYLLALGGVFLVPDFWLGKKIAKRQKKLTRG